MPCPPSNRSLNLKLLYSHEGIYEKCCVRSQVGYDHVYNSNRHGDFQEPVIEAIKAAEDRLTNSTGFLRFLGTHALILPEDLPRVSSDGDFTPVEEQYHFISLALNLANTFLYMVSLSPQLLPTY